MNPTTTLQPTSRRYVLVVALFVALAAAAIAILIAAHSGPRINASSTRPGSAAAAVSDRWYVETRNAPVQRDNWYVDAKAQPVADGNTDYRADRAYFHSLGIDMAASAPQNDTHQREMNRLRDLNEAAAPVNVTPAAAPIGVAGYLAAHNAIPEHAQFVAPETQSAADYLRAHAAMIVSASPALVQAEWQAGAEQATERMVQAHEDAVNAASGLSLPARDVTQRTGRY